MIDIELTEDNLMKEGTDSVLCVGKKNPKLFGLRLPVEYRLHSVEVRDPKDPEEPFDLWIVHCPKINMTYINKTEEQAMEDMHDCYEEDFITFYATRIAEIMHEANGSEMVTEGVDLEDVPEDDPGLLILGGNSKGLIS